MLSKFLRVNLLVFFYASSVLAHMSTGELETDRHGFNESGSIPYPQLVSDGVVNLPENDPQGWYRIVSGCCTWDGDSQNAACATRLATYSHDVLSNNSQSTLLYNVQSCSSVEPFVGFQTSSYWSQYLQKTVTCKNFVYKKFIAEPYGGLACKPYVAADGTSRYNCMFERFGDFVVNSYGGIQDKYIESFVPTVVNIERYNGTLWHDDPYGSYYTEVWENYRSWQADFSSFEYIQAVSTGDFFVTTPYTCGSNTGRHVSRISPYVLLPTCGGVDKWIFNFQYKDQSGKLVSRSWPGCSTTNWQLIVNHHSYTIPNDVLWTSNNTCQVAFSKVEIQGFLDMLQPGASLILVGSNQAGSGQYEFIQSDPPCGGMSGSGLGSIGREIGTTKKGLGSVGKGLGGYEKIYR